MNGICFAALYYKRESTMKRKLKSCYLLFLAFNAMFLFSAYMIYDTVMQTYQEQQVFDELKGTVHFLKLLASGLVLPGTPQETAREPSTYADLKAQHPTIQSDTLSDREEYEIIAAFVVARRV